MEAYRIPWDVWSAMKEHFGRKYVTEADVEKYRVPTAWNGVLMLLD
jgi:recombination protein U